MRILIFSAFDPVPSDEVGTTRYAKLAEEFMRTGHEVEYLTSSFFHMKREQRDSPRWDKNKSFPLMHYRLMPSRYYDGNGIGRARSHWSLARVVKDFLEEELTTKPDLVIIATPPLQTAHVLLKWCALNQIPVHLDIQDLWPDEIEKFLGKQLTKLLLYNSKKLSEENLRLASSVSAVSQDYLTYYKNIIREKQKAVFHLGMDAGLFKGEVKEPKDFLVHLGSVHDEKKLILVSENLAGFKVKVIGAGIIKSHRNIETVDRISQVEIQGEIGEALAGLALIKKGSKVAFPNKIFSYWMAGVPVITNIVGEELEEYINEHQLGICIHDFTVETVNKAIRDCKQRFGLRERKSIQEYAKEHFDSTDIYERFASFLLKLTNE